MRSSSSPMAACGVLLVAIALGALAARHRREHPPSPAVAIEPPAAAASGPVDLNRASAEVLERLPRIGPSLARRIVEDREANGPYGSVDELDRVRGVGPSTLEAVRPLVTVSAPADAASSLAPSPEGG